MLLSYVQRGNIATLLSIDFDSAWSKQRTIVLSEQFKIQRKTKVVHSIESK